jgi:helix-turn-helix protein
MPPATLERVESILDNLVSEAEICKRLRVTRQALFNWRRSSGLPYVKVGTAVRYHVPSIERWLKAGLRVGLPQVPRKAKGGEK